MKKIEIIDVFTGAINVQNKYRHCRQSHSTDPRGSNWCGGILFSILVWVDSPCPTSNGFRSLVSGLRAFWAQHMQPRKVRCSVFLVGKANSLLQFESGVAI